MDREPPVPQAGVSNELSGTVVGPSMQAGAIHGDVYLHATPRDAPPVPRQLLAASPYFTNRSSELSRMDDALSRPGPTLLVLTGPGGVGKTALALRWAHNIQHRFGDGQLYVDLGGFGGSEPVDPGEALTSFLRALGVSPRHIPATLAEQAALYRSVTAGRSLLVVLDDAYSSAQVRVLVPAGTAGVALVTSRSRLLGLLPDGAELVDVAPLGTTDSVQLLASAVGSARIARERDAAEELADMCGGLPIALAVAAARLAARPRLSVERMASQLADESSRLAGLSTADGPSVPAAFDVSYRFLEPAVAALYRKLALHPGPEFGLGTVAALTPQAGTGTQPAAVHTVDALLEASLLQEVDEDRFRFHDLVRLHARQRAELDDGPGVRDAALLAMLNWYLLAARRADVVLTPYRRRLPYQPATIPSGLPQVSGRGEALAWLERERVNLIAAGRAALEQGLAELAWHLSDVLWPLFLYRKHYRDRMEVDRRGVAAAQVWGNTWAEADMLKRLGRVDTTTRDYASAERHLRAAISRYQEIGDLRGCLDAKNGLAALFRDSGRVAQAAAMLTDLLIANRQLGDVRGTGLVLLDLGMLLPELGRGTEAVKLLGEAERLLSELSDVEPYNHVRVGIGLAGAYLEVGDLDRAERAAVDAARRIHQLGSDFEHAEVVDLLGRIAERRGDAAAAERHYERALAVFEALDSPRATGVRRRLTGLGTAGEMIASRGDQIPAVGEDPRSD